MNSASLNERDEYGALLPDGLEQIDAELLDALLHFLPALEIIVSSYSKSAEKNNANLWKSQQKNTRLNIATQLATDVDTLKTLVQEHGKKTGGNPQHDLFAETLLRVTSNICKQNPTPIHLIEMTIKHTLASPEWDACAKVLNLPSSATVTALIARHRLERGHCVNGLRAAIRQKINTCASKRNPGSDLTQQALLTIHEGTRTYDPRLGAKFSTYIWKGIPQSIDAYRAKQNPFKISQYARRQIEQMNALLSAPEVPIGRDNQIGYVAKKLNTTKARAEELLCWCFRDLNIMESLDDSIPGDPDDVHYIVQDDSDDESELQKEHDLEFKDENVTTIATTIADHHSYSSSVEGAQSSSLREKIEIVLKSLSYREREIIKLRYGISDGFIYTLDEVGRVFNVTGHRIRQIETKAIRKLQDPVIAKQLRHFLPSSFEEEEGETELNAIEDIDD